MKNIRKSNLEAYKISKDGEYAIIGLDINVGGSYNGGEIIVSSSYGTWSYNFSNTGMPFKNFLIKLSKEYVAGKFLMDKAHVLDWDRTKEIFDTIKHEDSSLLEIFEYEPCDLREVYTILSREEDICEDVEYLVKTKIDPYFSSFWEELWPIFIEKLKEETKND